MKTIVAQSPFIQAEAVELIMKHTDLSPFQQGIIENGVKHSSTGILAMMIEIVNKLETNSDAVINFDSHREYS